MKRTPGRRGLLAATTVAALAVTLASCASSSRDTASIASQNNSGAEGTLSVGESSGGASATGGGPASTDGTFIFGAAGAPSMFDPLYATDGATFKVTRQMTEGLVAYTPGTADVEPALAESWEPSEDALTWTFKIRQGVKFHDGTDLDAAAVCFNLDRMYSQTGAGATQAQYWSDTMGGFKGQVDDTGAAVPSIYSSCTASDASTAVIALTRVTSKFPNILGLPSFSIQSPTALAQYDANNVVAEGDSFQYPAYALEHPTGTGPFVFTKYDTANGTVELTRNEGRGVADHFGLTDKVDLICGSFSKSLASTGGFLAGDRSTVEYLRSNSRQIIFSAAITPSAAAAALESLRVMQREPEHRTRLWENTRYLQNLLRAIGVDFWQSPTPAVPIVIGDKEKCYFIWKSLQEQGFFTVMSTSPGVPVGKDLIRTAVSALHTREMLDRFGDALKVAMKKAGYRPLAAVA